MIDLRSRIPSGHTGRFAIPNLDEVEGIAVHHSVSGWVWNPLTQWSTCHWNDAVDIPSGLEVAHLLAIDRWHSPPNNDWGGFGYHVAAFASGRVYLVGSLNTVRAHVASLNKRFMGLVLIGDLTDAVPLESHLEAAKEGMAFIRTFYGRALPPAPHRTIRLQNTTCPGDRWQEWMPLLEKEEADMKPPLYQIQGRPEVYFAAGGKLFHIPDQEKFRAQGYKDEDVQVLPVGNPIWDLPVEYVQVPLELR